MFEPYNFILIAALAAVLWMARGGRWHDDLPDWFPISLKIPATASVAGLYIYIIGYSHWALIFVVWLPFITQILGTGDYMGKFVHGHGGYPKDGTGWEKFQWTNNAWWTGATAGLLWTFPCLWLGYLIDPHWYLVTLAHTVSVPMAGILSRKLFEAEDRWLAIEGLLAGVAMLVVSLLTTG